MNKIKKMIKKYQVEIKVVGRFLLLLIKFVSAYTLYYILTKRMVMGAYNLANAESTVEELLQVISTISQVMGFVVVLYGIVITIYRKQGIEDCFRMVFHYQARMYFTIAVITLFIIGVMNNTHTSYRDEHVVNDLLLIVSSSIIAVISNKLYHRLNRRTKMSCLSNSKVLGKARKDYKVTYIVDPKEDLRRQ